MWKTGLRNLNWIKNLNKTKKERGKKIYIDMCSTYHLCRHYYYLFLRRCCHKVGNRMFLNHGKHQLLVWTWNAGVYRRHLLCLKEMDWYTLDRFAIKNSMHSLNMKLLSQIHKRRKKPWNRSWENTVCKLFTQTTNKDKLT